MKLKETIRRLEIWISSPYFIFVFQTLVTGGLLVLTNILVKNPDVQLVAELGLMALYVFATWQTLSLKYDFRRYITRDLLVGLTSSQGRTISHVAIDKRFKEILPGDEYTVEFLIEGQQLIQVLDSKTVTPFLRMEPPLFRGNTEESNEQVSVWRGQPILCHFENGSWKLTGRITFDTYKINPRIALTPSAILNLGFYGEDGLLLDVELGGVPVHLITPQEVFRDLIRLEVLKKLPSGYHVLAVSRDHEFHTNIVFLSERFQEMKSQDKFDEQLRRLQAAMAHFVSEVFTEVAIRNPSKRLELVGYDPQPYESEINSSLLLEEILAVITPPQQVGPQVGPSDNVLLAIYQTPEFLMQLEREGSFGILLFGFGEVLPLTNVQVIFDLCKLELNHDRTGNPCAVDHATLQLLSESSKEDFEKYAPELSAVLVQAPTIQIPQRQSVGDLSPPQAPELKRETLEDLLALLHRPAEASLRLGSFVNSEPAIAPCWINLRIFENALYKAGIQGALEKAIISVIDRTAQRNDDDNQFVLNLCSEHSGIADELPTLWNFEHPSLPTGVVVIDRARKTVNLPHQITDINVTEEVIVLTPFDSYTNTLEIVLQHVREKYNNTVLCIVSLFSTAKTWEYLSASECFDVISLFRVHPQYSGLTPLTGMADYRRTKPWLFQL